MSEALSGVWPELSFRVSHRKPASPQTTGHPHAAPRHRSSTAAAPQQPRSPAAYCALPPHCHRPAQRTAQPLSHPGAHQSPGGAASTPAEQRRLDLQPHQLWSTLLDIAPHVAPTSAAHDKPTACPWTAHRGSLKILVSMAQWILLAGSQLAARPSKPLHLPRFAPSLDSLTFRTVLIARRACTKTSSSETPAGD